MKARPQELLPDDGGIAASELRIPPHSVEAEQSVLGGLLLDNSAWDRAGDLPEGDFYRHEHRLIYAAIGALINTARSADAITVFEQLQHRGNAEECGGLVYLNSLAQSVPSASGMRGYVQIVRDRAARRRLAAASDEIAASAFNPDGRPIADIIEIAQRTLGVVAASTERRAPFDLVDLSGVAPAEQRWFWANYVPAGGYLTTLSAHGGTGKTMIALNLACSIAGGIKYLDRATEQAKVCFFSAEDPRDLVLRRIRVIGRELNLDLEALEGQLLVVDATEFDPLLFVERRVDGVVSGATTHTYRALAKLLEERDIDVLIVDNASDTFGASEIDRSMVRAFCRSLVQLIRPRGGAVVLLAHVDKSTSRAGKGLTNTEAYSGSTAWNNSPRSRLFLVEQQPGALELLHQKCNVGPKQPPLQIEWPEHGIPRVVSAAVGPMQEHLDDGDTRTVLRLLEEFNGRGEYVATATQSRRHAVALMGAEKSFPKRKPAEIFDLLRGAERRGWIERDKYRDAGRKSHERWVLTDAGKQFAGLAPGEPPGDSNAGPLFSEAGAADPKQTRGFAPCAPCAPTGDISATSRDPEPLVRHVRHVAIGGYGGIERCTFDGADGDGR